MDAAGIPKLKRGYNLPTHHRSSSFPTPLSQLRTSPSIPNSPLSTFPIRFPIPPMVSSEERSTVVANGGTGDDAADPVHLSRLASWWRSGSSWDTIVEETDREDMPSHLNTVNSSAGFNAVSTDKLSVQYAGVPQHGHDVGAVQANCPAPTQRLVYYFEMTVKNAGIKGAVAIGFTPQGVKMCRQPGWEPNSCGYHGDDGFVYCGTGRGESFGPTFTSHDTVGAGINYASQEFFFTKNGEPVGRRIPKNFRGALFPTIAVHSQNEEVSVNFGQHPFLFNVEAFELEERKKQQTFIDKTPLPPDLRYWIVQSYLIHYGYEDTLNSFDIESRIALTPAQSNTSEQGDMFELNHRKILRQMIRAGDIDSTFRKLQEWYPQVLQNGMSTMSFLLYSQRFIEHIRIGKLEDAVKYARAQMAKFFSIKSFEPLLQDCIALLAYEDPSASPVGYLLGMSQREIVADAVNLTILSTNPNSKVPTKDVCSHLEKLLKQLTACYTQRRALNGHQGETFHLHRVLRSTSRRGKC